MLCLVFYIEYVFVKFNRKSWLRCICLFFNYYFQYLYYFALSELSFSSLFECSNFYISPKKLAYFSLIFFFISSDTVFIICFYQGQTGFRKKYPDLDTLIGEGNILRRNN